VVHGYARESVAVTTTAESCVTMHAAPVYHGHHVTRVGNSSLIQRTFNLQQWHTGPMSMYGETRANDD
jgi:hypothetical protein